MTINTDVEQHFNIRMDISSSIFRAYDIRGVVGEELDEDVIFTLGLAIGSEIRESDKNEVLIARDHRLSAEAFRNALSQGLMASGCNVIDLGILPTPALYFASFHLNVPNALILTASHNPGNYNGIKMVLNGETLKETGIKALESRIETQSFIRGKGGYSEKNILPDYIHQIESDITLQKPKKVVIDCGNGALGPIAPKVLRDLGCEIIELYCEPDGRFPHHEADPAQEENLQDLIASVKDHQADLGIAFDGDGDRIGVVTCTGEIIWPDRLLMLFAKSILPKHPGASILYDVKSSCHLAATISEFGGNPVMSRTGHSIIKAKMKELKSPLAGEMSGHIFFADRYYGFDDGLYAALRLLEILSQDNRNCVDYFKEETHQSVNTPELRIPIHETRKFSFVETFIQNANFEQTAGFTTIDGLRVDFAYGWGLIRASNTSPYLVLRFEADTETELKSIQNMFRQQLLAVDSDLEIPF